MIRIDEDDVRRRVHPDERQFWHIGIVDICRLSNNEDTSDGENGFTIAFRCVTEHCVVKQLEVSSAAFVVFNGQQDRGAKVVI